MHNPAGYGTRNIPQVEIIQPDRGAYPKMQYIGPSSPMGFLGDASYGMAELQRKEEATMQQTPSGHHVHLFTAGIVTGAIVLLVIMGIVFPGAVQF